MKGTSAGRRGSTKNSPIVKAFVALGATPRRLVCALIAVNGLLLTGATHASEINIDFGTNWGAPAATYAGAVGQPGFWNDITTLGISSLSDLDGNALNGTSLDLDAQKISGSSGSPGTDVQNLVNDNFFSSTSTPPGTWSLSIVGLDNGVYDVVYYAPSNVLVTTSSFSINGVTAADIFNFEGNTTALTQGVTHSILHDIAVDDGTLRLDSGDHVRCCSGLAGLQLTNFRPALGCVGFLPPFDGPLGFDTGSKQTLPVRMELLDGDGFTVTDKDIPENADGKRRPPVINVVFDGAILGDVPGEDDDLLSPGSADRDNLFRYDEDSGTWSHNLGTERFAAPGTYTVTVTSGDKGAYVIGAADGQCSQTFERLP